MKGFAYLFTRDLTKSPSFSILHGELEFEFRIGTTTEKIVNHQRAPLLLVQAISSPFKLVRQSLLLGHFQLGRNEEGTPFSAGRDMLWRKDVVKGMGSVF